MNEVFDQIFKEPFDIPEPDPVQHGAEPFLALGAQALGEHAAAREILEQQFKRKIAPLRKRLYELLNDAESTSLQNIFEAPALPERSFPLNLDPVEYSLELFQAATNSFLARNPSKVAELLDEAVEYILHHDEIAEHMNAMSDHEIVEYYLSCVSEERGIIERINKKLVGGA